MVIHLSSDSLVTRCPGKGRKSFLEMRVQVLCVHNLFLERIEGDGELPGTQIHFSKLEASDRGYDVFTRNWQPGMLKEKDYRALDSVFLFVAAFIYRGKIHERELY